MRFHLPLHLSRKRNLINLYLFEKDWQMAINQIECHPRECQIWSSQVGFFIGDHESRVLPIHIACSLHAPLEVVIAIVEANPSCLSAEENSLLQLPIHIACKFGAPVDVIEYLARKNVAGTMEPDVMSRLPIHYACSNGASTENIRTLLRVNSASMACRDCNGWLPLHVAVRSGASTELVREMVRVCPTAVMIKTKKSSTVLSLAKKAQTKNRKEVIEMLKCAMVAETNDKRQYSSLRRVSKAA
mmetsp:Transcript_2430/g.5390  ORF Transcript_2430/g.5390 Transcript_2430/m.5390 type:complete len:244 (-) Transcript_2430:243-974(-)